MARLPTVAGDSDAWGTVLNDFLDSALQSTTLNGAVSAGASTITVGHVPPNLSANHGFVVIEPFTINCEIRRVASIASNTLTLTAGATLTSTAISFDAATKKITGPVMQISKFFPGARITVTGSTSNNGTYTIASYPSGGAGLDGTTITVNETLVNEAAGASVTITMNLNRAHADSSVVLWWPDSEIPLSLYGVKADASTASASNNRTGFQRAIDDGYWTGVNQFVIPWGAGRVFYDETVFLERGMMLRGTHPNASILAPVAAASFTYRAPDNSVFWCRRDGFVGTLNNVGNERWFLRDFQLDLSANTTANGIVWGPNQPDALENIRIEGSSANATGFGMAIVGTQQISLTRLMVTNANRAVRLIGSQFVWFHDFNVEQPRGTNARFVSIEDFPDATSGLARNITVTNAHFENNTGIATTYFNVANTTGVSGLKLEGIYATAINTDTLLHIESSTTNDSTYSIRQAELNGATTAVYVDDDRRGINVVSGDFPLTGTFNILPSWDSSWVVHPRRVKAVTTTYTIKPVDDLVTADATGGAFTVTLPTSVGLTGRTFTIKRLNSGANAVTVGTTSSQTIDGATTYALGAQYDAVTVVSDGTNWHIVGEPDTTGGGGGGGFPAVYKSGSYYVAPSSPRSTDAGAAVTLNQVYYVPFAVGEAQTFDRIAVSVTTSAATAVVRLGIYGSTDGVPGSLLVDAGTIDASTTGYKELTISQALAAGTLYWVAIVNQTAGSVQLRHASTGAGCEWVGDTLTSDIRAAHFAQASVTGALPATATPATGGVQSPIAKLRAV